MISQIIESLEHDGFTLSLAPEGKLSVMPSTLTTEQVATIKQYKKDILQSLMELNNWIESLKQCRSQQEVFDILSKFQRLHWTNHQRAKISHVYHQHLNRLNTDEWYGCKYRTLLGLPTEIS